MFFFFFLNISIIIADINKVRTILCSEMSPVYFDLFFFFFFFFSRFCETTYTVHSCIKQIVSKIFGNQGFY